MQSLLSQVAMSSDSFFVKSMISESFLLHWCEDMKSHIITMFWEIGWGIFQEVAFKVGLGEQVAFIVLFVEQIFYWNFTAEPFNILQEFHLI